MKAIFKGKRISDLFVFLPEIIKVFEDEVIDGESLRNQRIKSNMGYGQRYRAKSDTTVSAFFIEGIRHLFSMGHIKKEDIAAIVVTTFSPDYFMPNISSIVHKEFGFDSDVFTLDSFDGCASFLNGLINACLILNEIEDNKKVLLLNGDVVNRLPSNESTQKYNYPVYGGDGAAVAVIENTDNPMQDISVVFKTSGKNSELITMHDGAFNNISRFYTRVLQSDPGASFRFFQKVIPECISDVLEYSGTDISSIVGFSAVQANSLTIKKFADRFGISYDRMPCDLITRYGDSSGVLNAVGLIELFDAFGVEDGQKYMLISYGAGPRFGAGIIHIDKQIRYGIVNTEL